MWTPEETAQELTDQMLQTLAARLLGNQETRIGIVRRVREVLNRQLDQVERLQGLASDGGKKGWFLSEHDGGVITNSNIIIQVMLQDKPDRVNLSAYCPSTFAEQCWERGCRVRAWEFDHDDRYCWFNCLGQDRLAPGDILVGPEKQRWVVDQLRWNELDKTWWVHARKPKDDAIESCVVLEYPD